MTEYIAAGNVMIDVIRFHGQRQISKKHIGGPATFAYSGIKLYTDNVMQVSNVGDDFDQYFREWIAKNGVITDGFKVKCDYCNHSYLVYKEDGTYNADPSIARYRDDWIQDFGYMKTSPEEIGVFTKCGGVKGVYIAQNVDYVFWRKFDELKKRDGFKIMWEIEAPSSYKRYMPAVLNALSTADIFSINFKEACNLFGCETEEECIRGIQELPVELTIFRVGEKGLYSISEGKAHYLPTAKIADKIDPTGCGNCSTGGALYAFCEGEDPIMVGIMANVAAAMNIRQYGVMQDFELVRGYAFEKAKEIYREYK